MFNRLASGVVFCDLLDAQFDIVDVLLVFGLLEVANALALFLGLLFELFRGKLLFGFGLNFGFSFNLLLKLQLLQEVFVSH